MSLEGKVKLEEQPEEYKGRGIDVFMEVGLKAIETAVLLAVSGKNCFVFIFLRSRNTVLK